MTTRLIVYVLIDFSWNEIGNKQNTVLCSCSLLSSEEHFISLQKTALVHVSNDIFHTLVFASLCAHVNVSDHMKGHLNSPMKVHTKKENKRMIFIRKFLLRKPSKPQIIG